jgi:Raf kinase inhibitor-like YbhB/YbcL family protein
LPRPDRGNYENQLGGEKKGRTMNPLIQFKRISLPLFIATALMCGFASLTLWAQQHQSVDNNGGNGRKEFSVSSSTFTDGGTLPLITVWNQCSNYPGGSDESPELSWTNVPRRTQSFVVVAYDVTASFTHWGMYNISGSSNGLPLNAGIPNSPYGTQVANDFGDLSYDGPCPPPQFMPVSHTYVFTVYALDIVLPTLPTHGDFPPGAEALYQALIAAARDKHILDSASIVGHFPQPN